MLAVMFGWPARGSGRLAGPRLAERKSTSPPGSVIGSAMADFQFNRHVSSVAGFVGGHIGANHVLENCPCMMGIEFFGNYSNLKNTSEIYGSTFKHTFKSTFWGGGKIKAGFVMGSNCCLYAFVGGAIRYMQYRVYNVNTGNVIAKSRKWLPGALYGIGYAQTISSSNYLLSIEIERQGWHTKRFLAFDAAQNSYNNISKHEGFTVALKYSISL